MACPKFEIVGKTVILVSGYHRAPGNENSSDEAPEVTIQAVEKLRQSAGRHPDAVAFGYTAGRWVPAA